MSKAEKLKAKFRLAESQFKWDELVALLLYLGFQQFQAEGSRVSFTRGVVTIKLHRPHPQKEVKNYVVRQVREILQSEGLL